MRKQIMIITFSMVLIFVSGLTYSLIKQDKPNFNKVDLVVENVEMHQEDNTQDLGQKIK